MSQSRIQVTNASIETRPQRHSRKQILATLQKIEIDDARPRPLAVGVRNKIFAEMPEGGAG